MIRKLYEYVLARLGLWEGEEVLKTILEMNQRIGEKHSQIVLLQQEITKLQKSLSEERYKVRVLTDTLNYWHDQNDPSPFNTIPPFFKGDKQ